MNKQAPVRTDRETARVKLAQKIESQRKALEDKFLFTTIDPNYLIADAEHRLRWIDCAPEGANHLMAPMQGKDGIPMSGNMNENVGACKALRDARSARGLDPNSGLRITA